MATAWASVGLFVAALVAAALVFQEHLEALWTGSGTDRVAVGFPEAKTAVQTHLRAILLGTFLAFVIHTEPARRKVRLLLYGISVMLFTTDKRWRKSAVADPKTLKSPATRKRIIFIRHGESKWNEAFNKSKMPHKFLYNVSKALFNEAMLLPFFDSVLFDSPLNEEGFAQAKILARVIETYADRKARQRNELLSPTSSASASHMAASSSTTLDVDMAVLRGDLGSPSAVVVSSNLRRAAQTALVALRSRLAGRFSAVRQPGKVEQVKVLSSLQEVSSNVDTLTIAPPREPLTLPDMEQHLDADECESVDFALEGLEDLKHEGRHHLLTAPAQTINLRADVTSALALLAKAEKMANGGAVAFDLEAGADEEASIYRIDPESITVVHGGFAESKKKKKKEKAAHEDSAGIVGKKKAE